MVTEAAPGPSSPRFRWLHRTEDGLINVVLLIMAALPLLEMSLRLFDGSFSGSQVLVRHLTLWMAFLGAMLCTRERRHLAMSTAELLTGKLRERVRIGTTAVACAVTALLAVGALRMVQADAQGTDMLIGPIPKWWSELIMPLALAIMALRMAWAVSDQWLGRIICYLAIGAGLGLDLLEPVAEHLTWPGLIIIFAALILGAPIYVAMSGIAMLLFFSEAVPIAAVPTESLRLGTQPQLPAIPLLTVAGYVLGEGGAAKRLLRVAKAWFGWVPGGTAIIVCVVCALFTTLTGGSGVTILALGGLMLPILLADQYPRPFGIGLVTASGSLGLLFWPSLPVILYSVVADIPDLNALYVAGFVPGVLMVAMVCAYGMFVAVKSGAPRTGFDFKEAKSALWEAKLELLMPVVMGTAFLGGFATIVEVAAIAVAYAIAVQVFWFKDIPVKELPRVVVQAAVLVGSVLIVLGMAMGLTSYIVDAQLLDPVVAWVRAHIETQFGFLLTLNLILLVLGSVLEIYSAVVILPPLIVPLGDAYGVDRLHLAVVFLANLELGFLFPPVGLNLFLSSSRFQTPLSHLYRFAFPFLLIMALAVLLTTYIPAMTVGVVDALGIRH